MSEENIKGTIVRRVHDTFGEIIIADDGNMRSLYFGEGILQSSIQLDRPDMLTEDYNRAMMWRYSLWMIPSRSSLSVEKATEN